MQLSLSENIKKYRKEMGLTQEELAEAFGITIGAVSKWESGSTIPDIMTLIELADFFNISVDVLLGYSISSKSVDDIKQKINTLLKEARYDEAISETGKALIRYPANFKIVLEAAKTYNVITAACGYKKYLEKTISLYESALRLISQNTDPDVDEFSIRLCIAELKSQNNPEEALAEFKKINYMGIADFNIAKILMDMDRYDESMDRFTRVLVSILIKSLQYSSTMAIALIKTDKKSNLQEARDIIDWCLKIYDATTDNNVSYLTKMQAVLLILKGMVLSCLGDYSSMRICIDDAYKLARKFDKAPVNGLAGKIRFWHAFEDYKPMIYDELGPGAVQSIDSLFSQEPNPINPLPEKILKKMDPAEKYWNEIKTAK
ncbi:helix-turn-helix domain-containing protein [Butyrivibrio sp. WCD3002]|uniref:helix-turn-helix domain-containing protein n=1 Tax=Butyrivibrio sp. WCD3002 TaxID=1280676 RepID=UPI00041279F1|nr:helix-turn-helix domain-containing protein [Butyrivibrio sp. WCD3002]